MDSGGRMLATLVPRPYSHQASLHGIRFFPKPALSHNVRCCSSNVRSYSAIQCPINPTLVHRTQQTDLCLVSVAVSFPPYSAVQLEDSRWHSVLALCCRQSAVALTRLCQRHSFCETHRRLYGPLLGLYTELGFRVPSSSFPLHV